MSRASSPIILLILHHVLSEFYYIIGLDIGVFSSLINSTQLDLYLLVISTFAFLRSTTLVYPDNILTSAIRVLCGTQLASDIYYLYINNII